MQRQLEYRRHATPPAIAKELGVACKKVIEWIESGELKAINLARRGSTRPRYSIGPDALEDFKRGRQVIPAGATAVKRLRRKPQPGVREYV